MEAEERGQGEAIARNLYEMSALKTPVLSIVISEGGSGGGQIIATGTPEEVAKVKGSHTARFLKDILAKG